MALTYSLLKFLTGDWAPVCPKRQRKVRCLRKRGPSDRRKLTPETAGICRGGMEKKSRWLPGIRGKAEKEAVEEKGWGVGPSDLGRGGKKKLLKTRQQALWVGRVPGAMAGQRRLWAWGGVKRVRFSTQGPACQEQNRTNSTGKKKKPCSSGKSDLWGGKSHSVRGANHRGERVTSNSIGRVHQIVKTGKTNWAQNCSRETQDGLRKRLEKGG